MKGLPKHLNTKEDYLYAKDNYDRTYWEPYFQNLLDTRYDWFAITEDEYIEDDENYKKVEDEQNERTDYFFIYKENENAPIYRLGFTVEEVESILKG